MKAINKTIVAAAILGGLTLASCSDFLDKPGEDNYNVDNFYQNDEQVRQGVNPLYNSPWYDFQRGFFKVGEVLSGNYYWGQSPYLTFTLNGSDEDLANMSAALWAVNGHANAIMANIAKCSGPSETAKRYGKGECLVWKAMAYFYLVRTFGSVPIVDNNSEIIGDNSYNSLSKAKISCIYDYIVRMLESAIELLPEKDATGKGRLDKYCAEGLLAKVYLTKAGFSEQDTKYESGIYSYITTAAHTPNADDLAKAASHAKNVIEHSGRHLMENYADIFRGENNVSDESLIAWRWSANTEIWTCQNTFQSDLAPTGFDEFGDCWGGWNGPSIDLQDAFDEDATKQARNDRDDRRKATMMMPGDIIPYFYRDMGGFNVLKFTYNAPDYVDHSPSYKSDNQWQSPTGANVVKHLYGNGNDHVETFGCSASNMHSQLATHILRLADIYLVYCEAMAAATGTTTDADACRYFYEVRHRSIKSEQTVPTSLTFDDIWKERRLELACEGDRWYDYVRLYYYNPQRAISEIKAQRRGSWDGLNDLYKAYYNNGGFDGVWDNSKVQYNEQGGVPNVTDRSFTIPLPASDVDYNPHLKEPPVDVDVNQFSY